MVVTGGAGVLGSSVAAVARKQGLRFSCRCY